MLDDEWAGIQFTIDTETGKFKFALDSKIQDLPTYYK